MGALMCCLQDRDEASDPMLDAQARARAAEAAQNRLDTYANSAAGKRDAKMKAREVAANKGGISSSAHAQRINDIIS